MVFAALYENQCLQAIQEYSAHISTHQKFMADLKRQFRELFNQLESGQTAADLHCQSLHEVKPYVERLQVNQFCLCCLFNTPEKVLDCGHAICDNCIRLFGSPGRFERYRYAIFYCLLCQKPNTTEFSMLPPTAGIRILTIDGGGIRGIIPLTILAQLERDLSFLGIPIWDFFDFVVGTSSGNNFSFFFLLS